MSARPNEITQADSSKKFDIRIGEIVKLRLHENPTTGYRWHLLASGEPTLQLIEESFAPSTGAVGAGGMRSWIFRAALAGTTRLELEQRRSWQRQAIDKFNVIIGVMPG
jgi:inhibitor of cysteine peptidase